MGTLMTWSEAQVYCESFGSDLASIHSEADNAAALEICPGDTCWIGLRDDTYAYTDGSSYDYEDWNDVAPRAGKYNCVTLWYGQWSDAPCEWTIVPLCNGPLPSEDPTSMPTIDPSMYPTLEPTTSTVVVEETEAVTETTDVVNSAYEVSMLFAVNILIFLHGAIW